MLCNTSMVPILYIFNKMSIFAYYDIIMTTECYVISHHLQCSVVTGEGGGYQYTLRRYVMADKVVRLFTLKLTYLIEKSNCIALYFELVEHIKCMRLWSMFPTGY